MDFPLGFETTFELPEGEAHHIRNVLRGRIGDSFEVVDSDRRLFTAELREGGEATVLGEDHAREEELDVRLHQAVPKGKHMDLVVEKATELGVEVIVPLVTGRSVVKPVEERKKLARWRRVAEAAARQSLQLRVPEVREPVNFAEAARESGEDGIMLHNAEGLSALEECIERPVVDLYVGPEGGWSEEELDLAARWGFSRARIGPHRLRSETAGIVAVARARAALERAVERF